jgi:uncharacterized protein
MEQKYSQNGYIKLWIPNSPNAKRIKALREIIINPSELREQFNKYYTEETSNL